MAWEFGGGGGWERGGGKATGDLTLIWEAGTPMCKSQV